MDDAKHGIRVDWTLNFGHVLTMLVMIGGGFVAYLNLEKHIATVDERTIDYQVTRDITRGSDARIGALQTIVQSVGANNAMMLEMLTKIREDIATVKATLALRPPPLTRHWSAPLS